MAVFASQKEIGNRAPHLFAGEARDSLPALKARNKRGIRMEGLSGKVAIVTGGATKIGAAVVRAFLREGTKVVIADINEKDGRSIAQEMPDATLFVQTDLGDDAQ